MGPCDWPIGTPVGQLLGLVNGVEHIAQKGKDGGRIGSHGKWKKEEFEEVCVLRDLGRGC